MLEQHAFLLHPLRDARQARAHRRLTLRDVRAWPEPAMLVLALASDDRVL
jgi:hypothetical protein